MDQILKDGESGAYLQKMDVNGFTLEVRRLPNLYRAVKPSSLGGGTRLTTGRIDSLRAAGKVDGVMFLLSVTPAEPEAGLGTAQKFILAKSGSDGNFQKGMEDLAFSLSRNCWIEVSGQRFPIIQSQLENTWGIGRDTRFMVLFGKDARTALLRERKFSLVFDEFIPGQARTKSSWLFPLGRYDEVL